MKRSTLAVLLMAALPSAYAATFTPTRFDDPSPNGCLATDCSLREAVIAANATSAEDTIVLSSGTYTLSRGCTTDSAQCLDLDVTQPVKIIGVSRTASVIANDAPWFINPMNPVATDRRETRVIDIATTGKVSLEKLTLRAGALRGSSGNGANGGCLRSLGATVNLNDVRITDCETAVAGSGGGVATVGGNLSITNSMIDFNDAVTDGGGIHASGTRINGSAAQISDNVAAGRGGGISTDGQTLWLGGSTVARNSATVGGGIDRWLRADQINITGGSSPVAADRLIIEDNVASVMGGGIHSRRTSCSAEPSCTAPAASFLNLSVRRNEAGASGGGMHVFVEGSGGNWVTMRDASFAANISSQQAGGLYPNPSTGMNSVAERLSFWDNVATLHGGAVYHLGGTTLRHISSTRNIAQQGASLYFGAASDPLAPRVDHWTTHAEGPDAVFMGRPVQFYASAFDSACSGPAIDLGNNFKRNDVGGACPGTAVTSAQLGMAFGINFGNQPAVTINVGSVLRNAALQAPVGTRDARGYLRQGMADVGAFEFDGVP